MDYQSVLIEPVLSEKSNLMREDGKYVFKVDSRADKLLVMEAVRQLFKVTPVSCRIINVTSKPKRLRGRPGRTAEWKKAIVTIKKGETIRVFEGA
jgi:large subunit ribosomal protein L23